MTARARTEVEVDKRIQMWHDMPEDKYDQLGSPGLHDFLGWSMEEYDDWVTGQNHPYDWEKT